ncbi:Retron-type RNA-directed DNA polymerase [Methanosarcina lacustris Z-7289]|uniref:Retron-type RNA-directed DNA polymerase n=1 Tax=Methanosarcina lacustris Z-7289 TaxID=1434111 RepID=A0A0E3S7W1_9EURY|nr:retron St85 family RNA-directed DNA polymerase [Methanosarcina lacustris]AKB75143.1 Retron-type RNA-directed DNA polymerase [Methanosarcina lacustris Z-7289]
MTEKLTKNERLKVLFDDRIEEGVVPKLSEEDYNKEFKYFTQLKSKKLPYIYDIDHFCKLTNSSSKQVKFFLSNKEKAYATFKVPKKSGDFREINAPSKKMKIIQRWILDKILYKLNPGNYAHGFIPGKTIYTNAKAHVNKDLVLGIDIKDFFPSIKFVAVYDVFKFAGYTARVARQLAELCTYHWKLPQGAPTSPMLANLVALNLDKKISQYCIRENFEYSRYADDITISGSYNLAMHKEIIIKIINENGFEVNYKKVRMVSKGSRQKVTGLVVNDKVGMGRTKKKTLRAIVHNILMNGPVFENRDNDPFFRERIFGYLGCANAIDPEFTSPLIDSLKKIDWSEYEECIKEIKESEINVNHIKRINKVLLVKFDELGFFRKIAELPEGAFSEEFKTKLESLQEKCDVKIHGVEACSDCLDVKKVIYNKCMKYVLGHYTGTTGGHHHGHEIYDMKALTDYNGENITVAFLMKSANKPAKENNSNKENSLVVQTLDCTDYNDSINLISIVSNNNLSNKSCERLEKIIKGMSKGKEKEQLYCFIMKKEMKRILYDFYKNYQSS